jgi:formate hydrogenlyase transcriptional activator
MLTGMVRVQELPQKHETHFRDAPAASGFEGIVGWSDELSHVLSHVRKVAATDATVLITGESRTGKEMIGEAIHNTSRRAGRPFLQVNCAAITPSLIASELFASRARNPSEKTASPNFSPFPAAVQI